jgi:RNA polymerase sigma-70 factor (ECF subfamily)
MTSDRENAEDVVQETFLKADRNLQRFDGRARFGTWLHRIAANCAMDLLRRQQRSPPQEAPKVDADPFDQVESAEPGPFRLALSGEIERRIEQALDDLTPLERTAFVLRHFEQQSIGEIGKALGSKTSATKQAVFRAVRKLREDLAPLMEKHHAQSA